MSGTLTSAVSDIWNDCGGRLMSPWDYVIAMAGHNVESRDRSTVRARTGIDARASDRKSTADHRRPETVFMQRCAIPAWRSNVGIDL